MNSMSQCIRKNEGQPDRIYSLENPMQFMMNENHLVKYCTKILVCIND